MRNRFLYSAAACIVVSGIVFGAWILFAWQRWSFKPLPPRLADQSPTVPAVLEPALTPMPVATLRFVNFGDWGNSKGIDRETFRQLERTHATLGFTDIVTNGDNNYGATSTFPVFVRRELGALQDVGVRLHFTLGNHDVDSAAKLRQQTGNLAWGEWDCRACLRPRPQSSDNRYYSFYRAPVRFVMLDSNLLRTGDADQLLWAVQEITASTRAGEPWQALVFHHPPFSAAQTHGSATALAEKLTPILRIVGVDVVLSGHDHTYERIKTTPECGNGVQYVVSGAVHLRKGDIKAPNGCTAAYWDQTPAFLYVTATPTEFAGQAITRDGKVVDRWEIRQSPQ